jgi:hypothetical protein
LEIQTQGESLRTNKREQQIVLFEGRTILLNSLARALGESFRDLTEAQLTPPLPPYSAQAIKVHFFAEGLASYAMPQGVQRGSELDLTDRTYDGIEEAGFLTKGLGQLADGRRGSDNFRSDANGDGKGENPSDFIYLQWLRLLMIITLLYTKL